MDLTTSYLGLSLRSPLVASASPLSMELDDIKRVADAGCGAMVMYSLFEEQVREAEIEDLMVSDVHANAFGEAADGYFPDAPTVSFAGARPYLRQLERAVGAVEIPVIASLNGSTTGGWTSIASSMESAGAAALELNIYQVPGDVHITGAQVEQSHLDILASVRQAVSIPVAVKLSPFFSSTGAMALALADAGAAGLVLFNRFLPPDVEVETLAVGTRVSLSSAAEGKLPRSWIAILRHQVACSLAGTTGVETADDVIAYLLAGADVVQTASALLRHGPSYAEQLLGGLTDWLDRRGYTSVADVRGLLAVAPAEAGEHQRTGYVTALDRAHRIYGGLHHHS